MTPVRWILPLCLLAASAACSPLSPPEPEAMAPEQRQWSLQLHRQLNIYRRNKGLAPLKHHEGLQQLALSHSDWLKRKRGSSFHHGSNVSHSGSQWRARMAHLKHGMESWGENVAYLNQTPQDVAINLMVMWKASPSHQKAMLGDWTHAGNAITVDEDGAIFATLNFGRLQNTQPANN